MIPRLILVSISALSPLAAQPYWPTTDAAWQTTTATAAGADPVLLADALSYARQANSNSLIILHGGRILSEQYTGGWTRTTKGTLYSASKAMIAALMGKLVSSGEFTSLDQKSAAFVPEWQNVTGKKDITLRHHLTMTTGLEGGEQNLFLGAAVAKNERTFAVNLPLEHAPGTYWTYNNPAYRLLFSIIQSATNDTLPNVSAQHLFNPLGMSAASWVVRTTTVGGNSILNYQFVDSNALSAARFGLLAQRGGVWNGAQLIPASAIAADTTSSQAINPSYGQLWWLNTGATGGHQQLFDGMLRSGPYFPDAPPDLFAAIGKDDQIIACIPSLDLVIVRQGTQPMGAGSEAISAEQNILFGKIARAFGYAGQTQPFDFTIAPISGGVRLCLLTWFGRKYHITGSPDLGVTPWINVTPAVIEGNGMPTTFDHTTTLPRNFYRGVIVE